MSIAIWLWASAHQVIIILLIGLSMWAAAYMWYFRDDWLRYRRDRRPHKWSVDMVTKTGAGGPQAGRIAPLSIRVPILKLQHGMSRTDRFTAPFGRNSGPGPMVRLRRARRR